MEGTRALKHPPSTRLKHDNTIFPCRRCPRVGRVAKQLQSTPTGYKCVKTFVPPLASNKVNSPDSPPLERVPVSGLITTTRPEKNECGLVEDEARRERLRRLGGGQMLHPPSEITGRLLRLFHPCRQNMTYLLAPWRKTCALGSMQRRMFCSPVPYLEDLVLSVYFGIDLSYLCPSARCIARSL